MKLSNYPGPAEELAKKDDLTLLFSAITSWCPPHNSPWRKGAAEVLTAISRHGLTQEVVQYIHSEYLKVAAASSAQFHGVAKHTSFCSQNLWLFHG